MGAEATDRCVPQFILDDSRKRQAEDEWESERAEEVTPYHRRKSAGVWVGLATLAVALAVVAGYGYLVLNDQDSQLAQIPGLASSLPAINQHLSSLEKRIDAWRDDQRILSGQIQKTDSGWKSALVETREQTAALIVQAQGRLNRELNERMRILNSQILQIESDQRDGREHLAKVEGQLAEARQELASVRRNYSLELATLREQQEEAQREIASLNNVLTTHQVAFEIQEDEAEEIVPGVSVHLKNTDVRHQRFDAWIEPSSDGERLWVRGQGIEQPFVFYPNQQDKAFELVVTRVNDRGVCGYLLVPASDGAMNQARVEEGNSPTPVTLFPSTQSGTTGP